MDPPCVARENDKPGEYGLASMYQASCCALQEKTISLESTVLHQCIRPRVGAHAPDHHGNPRASDLITGHASEGYWGHQFSDALGRPFLHLFYFSRRPRWAKDRGAYIACLLIASTSS